MDLRSGHPWWQLKNGVLRAFPPLEKDTRCDVLVIGAGITGALTAFHLAEAGFDTLVIDRRDAAWGSTSASTALLQYEIDTPLYELISRLGRDHAVRAYQACRDALEKLRELTSRLPDSCGFAARPSLQIAPVRKTAAELRLEFEARTAHGFAPEWWEPDTFTARGFPFTRPAGIRSAEGAQVDPYRLAYELLSNGQALGMKVHDRTAVTGYDLTARGITARTGRGAVIRASHVVFATGYEATELLKRRIVDLNSSWALVTEPLPAPLWPDECLIWEKADPYLYFRTTGDHRGPPGYPGRRGRTLPGCGQT